ncbi:AAA family ATPase [Streptomyces sp. NPDC051940]|uniref:AAA family ATPase n=1 Tax=Streptomyces sp. NPDC051940 TaxID=3155675 RepID=UPI003413D091
MIVWLNGTFGAGKTTTSKELVGLLPDARIFDAEYVGYMLCGGVTGLPALGDFQHWPPWRRLVVETATQLLEYVGGTLVVPQTVLDEPYWTEISEGLAKASVPVHHFVLHADPATIRHRIETDPDNADPHGFRMQHVEVYERSVPWLHAAARVVDTTDVAPREVARRIAAGVGVTPAG